MTTSLTNSEMINSSIAILSIDESSEIKKIVLELENLHKNMIDEIFKILKEKIKAMDEKFSENAYYDFFPYLYLRIIYTYQGAPAIKSEGLLAIDEAQNLAVVEYKLLNDINKGVVFNLYGDINQHVETEKGIDSWSQVKNIVNFEVHNMDNNYRNAMQITKYCNKTFKLKMKAINVSGKQVKQLSTKKDIETWIETYLTGRKKNNLVAIVYKNEKILSLIKKTAKKNCLLDLMNFDNNQIVQNKLNVMTVDKIKGLEFKTVLVIEDGMSKNEKYIAYTRALDELIVCEQKLDS